MDPGPGPPFPNLRWNRALGSLGRVCVHWSVQKAECVRHKPPALYTIAHDGHIPRKNLRLVAVPLHQTKQQLRTGPTSNTAQLCVSMQECGELAVGSLFKGRVFSKSTLRGGEQDGPPKYVVALAPRPVIIMLVVCKRLGTTGARKCRAEPRVKFKQRHNTAAPPLSASPKLSSHSLILACVAQ